MTEYAYSTLIQGDVIVYPIQYKDKNGVQVQKIRPVLVASNGAYNSVRQNRNIVVFPITSVNREWDYDISIKRKDLIDFRLNEEESVVRVDKPAIIRKDLIVKSLGKMQAGFIQKIKKKIRFLYEIRSKSN